MSTSNDQRLREVIEQLQAENAHLRARVESDPSTPPPDDVDAAHWKRDSWGWTLLSTILIIAVVHVAKQLPKRAIMVCCETCSFSPLVNARVSRVSVRP